MSQYVDFSVRLRNLADQMEDLGADMDYYEGIESPCLKKS